MRRRLAIGALGAILLVVFYLPELKRCGVTCLESTAYGARFIASGFIQPKRTFDPDAWKQVGLTPRSFQLDLGKGVRTLALYVPALPPSKGTVILLHGYGKCLDVTASYAKHLRDAGYNTLSVDQRGHGHNTARFCTFGCVEKHDVTSAISFLEAKGIGREPFMVLGTSMGAAVGIQAMEIDTRIRCGVFDSSFDSLIHVAPKWLADAGVPDSGPVIKAAEEMTGSLLGSVSPASAIRHVDRPVFILHGLDDSMIPKDCAEELYADASSSRKRILLVEHANHAQVLADQEPWTDDVWAAIVRFLDGNRT